MNIFRVRLTPNSFDFKLLCQFNRQAIALTGRLSKAFSNQHTMKSLACVQLFLDALGVFLQMLALPIEESLMAQLQSSVRQYLHRLVVCLEEELLPYIPVASQSLLKNCDCKSIQEYIPLINQVITKFKVNIFSVFAVEKIFFAA